MAIWFLAHRLRLIRRRHARRCQLKMLGGVQRCNIHCLRIHNALADVGVSLLSVLFAYELLKPLHIIWIMFFRVAVRAASLYP